MSEKGQVRKSMFSVQNMEELGRLYESDTPVLAYDFKRRMVEGWTPEHSHHRGQLVALMQGLLIVETENERWLFPSQRCAWTPPNCKHAARSVGGAAGSMVDLSPEMCRGLPKTPCVFNTSELLFAIVHRMVGWDLRQPLDAAKKHLIATLRDEIRQPDRQLLRLTIPREERLAMLRRWLRPNEEGQELMYKGHPFLGTILSAHPLRLGVLLSGASILLLLLPALWAHVALIKDTASPGWPGVGFWQRWNWSAMYVVVLPLIFAGTAALSRACASIFASLTIPETNGAEATVTKLDGSPASDFLASISTEISRSRHLIFGGVFVITAALTIADVALIARGYFLRIARHVAFPFPDSDWSVAFQLSRPAFDFYGWSQRGPASNLAFDFLAYTAQTLAVFFGLFWIAKYWATLNSFSKQLIDNEIDFRFNPWWSDPLHRMGLLEVGKLFTGFLFVAVLFQVYVFGHRLQLIARAGTNLSKYADEIMKNPKSIHVLWEHRAFQSCTLGMWLLLIFVLLPVVVISWVPLLRFRRYLRRIIAERHRTLRGDLKRFPEGSAERKTVLREWDEVNAANIWPNGDFAGWIFLTLMVVLTIAAWFPPGLGYLAVGGGGALLLKLLGGFLPKAKAAGDS